MQANSPRRGKRSETKCNLPRIKNINYNSTATPSPTSSGNSSFAHISHKNSVQNRPVKVIRLNTRPGNNSRSRLIEDIRGGDIDYYEDYM